MPKRCIQPLLHRGALWKSPGGAAPVFPLTEAGHSDATTPAALPALVFQELAGARRRCASGSETLSLRPSTWPPAEHAPPDGWWSWHWRRRLLRQHHHQARAGDRLIWHPGADGPETGLSDTRVQRSMMSHLSFGLGNSDLDRAVHTSFLCKVSGFPGGSVVRSSPANAGDWLGQLLPLGGDDPQEEGMATHSSMLAWRIPWPEEPGGATVHGVAESDMTTIKSTSILHSSHTCTQPSSNAQYNWITLLYRRD